MHDEAMTLDKLQKRMNWGLIDIDYQLRAENLIIIRRGGKLKFAFLSHVATPEQPKRYEPAKDVAKHVGRKSY